MRAILFDKDGTLLDFHASWSGLYRTLALELCGGDRAAADRLLETGGMDPTTGRVRAGSVLAAGNTIDIAKAWFPEFQPDDLARMVKRIDRTFYENGVRCSVPVAGLRQTLDRLAASGLFMGVATSDGTEAARAAIGALGLSNHLPHIFGYDSVARPKPAPDMVYAFAEATGTALADIAVVGDNLHDLHMARSAGAGAAIGVLTGTGERHDLAALADAVLDSIGDLPDWLSAWAGR